MFLDFFNGLIFGVANIIPGVSGGTLALVLGFYERLIRFLDGLNLAQFKEIALLKLRAFRHPFTKSGWRELFAYCREKDWFFILRLAFGAVVAIVLLSGLMKSLLREQFEFTYAFFFGLILLSVSVPWALVRQKRAAVYVAVLLGIVGSILLAAAVDPSDKILRKSAVYEERVANESDAAGQQVAKKFTYTGKYEARELIMIGLSGALAVSAMILPGVSGSLLLILLGQYFNVITAIADAKKLLLDEFVFLGIFALGMGGGLLLTAKLLRWALDRFHDPVMGVLTGLVLGSLYALWPFKRFLVEDVYMKEGGAISLVESAKIYTNENVLPAWGEQALYAGLFVLLGAVVMFGLSKLEKA